MIDYRPYQAEAVRASEIGLAAPGSRGQIIHPCGTGKTITALQVVERIVPPGGLVVWTCPTLDLVDQTLTKILGGKSRPMEFLAVGSDDGVADSAVRVADIPCPVTTDSEVIAAWAQRRRAEPIRLILSTVASAERVGDALLAIGTTANLLLVDEAHETAGLRAKASALVHDDRRLPAERRLYLTATPRLLGGRLDSGGEDHLITMDGPEFGPRLHVYPYSAAVRDGYLDDYEIAVIGVTRLEVLAALRRVDPRATVDAFGASLHSAAVQVAVARAARQWDLRRIIAFCPRVADAQAFARTLPRTVASLDPEVQPLGPLTAAAVWGKQTVEQRKLTIDMLREPPDGGWTVLANARVLGRGVDVPAGDGIVFTHPKESAVDIVQAVGRVARPHPEGRRTAIVLVPILLSDEPHELTDIGEPAEYETLWSVLRALRAHDDALAEDLDRCRVRSSREGPPELPQKLVIQLPPGFDDTWLDHLRIRIVRSTTSPWWDGVAAAQHFHGVHGHLRVPKSFVTDDSYPTAGYNLGQWIMSQRRRRRQRRRGSLGQTQIDVLDKLGMLWEPREVDWWYMFDRVVAVYQSCGGTGPFALSKVDHPGEANWLNRQRTRREGLHPDMIAALDAHNYDWRLRDERGLARGLAAAEAYFRRTGHLVVPSHHHEEGVDLHGFLTRVRRRYRQGELPPNWVAAFERLNIDWNPRSPRSSGSAGLDTRLGAAR